MKYDVILGKKTFAVEIEKTSDTLYAVRVDGTLFEVDARNIGNSLWSMMIGHNARDIDVLSNNGTLQIAVDGDGYELEVVDELRKSLRDRKGKFKAEGPQEIRAPMPGKVVKVLVSPGEAVEEGQGLVIVEAMKMENILKSAIKGVVKEIFISEGQAVEARMPLATVEPVEAAEA